jgi:tetraacyldisaccharide 4'-kinase
VVAPAGETARPVPGVRVLDRNDPGLARELGDEAAVVALRCPGAALLVGRRKREAVELAARLFGAAVVVLDDAFQSWALHRDVDIVLVSDPVAVAAGRLLPSGRLREEIDALSRADAVMVPASAMAATTRLRPHLGVETPVLALERRIELPAGVGGAVGTVTALARPSGMEEMLRERGLDLRLCVRFPDHHRYDAGDVASIAQMVDAHRLDAIVTTEKDWVKLRHLDGSGELPLHVVRLDVGFSDSGAIEEMLKPRRQAAASA